MPSTDDLPVLYKHLRDSQLFRKLAFNGDPGHWDNYFHETRDISEISKQLSAMVASDSVANAQRIVGVRANIGDGKTTLLSYLKRKFPNYFPVYFPAGGFRAKQDDTDAHWRVVRLLVLQLLFSLKQHKDITENDYNTADLDLENTSKEMEIHSGISKHLRKLQKKYADKPLLWLCDDVRSSACMSGFQLLIDLHDAKAPFGPIFGNIPILLVFSTVDRGVETDWKNTTGVETFDDGATPSDTAGHRACSLRVRKEDAANIVKVILAGCSKTAPPSIQDAFKRCQSKDDTAFFPFESDGLAKFLENKAKKVPVKDERTDIQASVSEIQLRNTLFLLQHTIDKAAIDRPIGLADLQLQDTGVVYG